MSKYYIMSTKSDDSTNWATSRTEEGYDSRKLWSTIENLTEPEQWPGLDLTLDEGVLSDYLSSNVIGRMYSPRIVSLLQPYSKNILWLPVKIHGSENKIHDFYFMHIPFIPIPDILDIEKTKYVGELVLRPHVSIAKSKDWPIFILNHSDIYPIVCEDIKKAIEALSPERFAFKKVSSS